MLVIIPGWMHDAAQWSEVSRLLEQQNIEHRILNLPGFGTIPANPDINTFQDLCAFVRRKIDYIENQSSTPLSVLGHSCGGRIGLQLVADGLAVRKLILVGSPNLYRPDTKTKIMKNLASIFSPFKILFPEAIKQLVRSADYQQAKGTHMQNLYLDVIRDDQTELLRMVTIHIDLIWGAYDKAAPLTIAREMSEKLPVSSLHIFPNLGHNLHQENPRLLTGKIISLLNHD